MLEGGWRQKQRDGQTQQEARKKGDRSMPREAEETRAKRHSRTGWQLAARLMLAEQGGAQGQKEGRGGLRAGLGQGRGQVDTTEGFPASSAHLPTQARPKASRWKPALQSQR